MRMVEAIPAFHDKGKLNNFTQDLRTASGKWRINMIMLLYQSLSVRRKRNSESFH